MTELFLIILLVVSLFYMILFGIPKHIKRVEDKIDTLQLQIKELQIIINKLSDKIDN